MNRPFVLAAATGAGLLAGGCAGTLPLDRPSLQHSHVKPVLTEHSLALACLGDLIDQGGKPRLSVYVRPIPDKTVPSRYEDRRLSLGGKWWLHTAIDKIGSERVVSVTSRERARQSDHYIEITGAWTQDDFEAGRRRAELDAGRSGSSTDVGLFAGTRSSFDVIAGDFISVRNGQVVHATAISLAVGSRRDGMGLRIQSGVYDVELDLSTTVNEGPQFAQRRITEAAALVHVGRAFDIDYRPCIEMGWASSAEYQAHLHAYLAMPADERHRTLQKALRKAGYQPGAPDGVWGANSSRAMMRFQADLGLPISGRPSAEMHSALLRAGSKGPEVPGNANP